MDNNDPAGLKRGISFREDLAMARSKILNAASTGTYERNSPPRTLVVARVIAVANKVVESAIASLLPEELY